MVLLSPKMLAWNVKMLGPPCSQTSDMLKLGGYTILKCCLAVAQSVWTQCQ
jgi:hypothetical protein